MQHAEEAPEEERRTDWLGNGIAVSAGGLVTTITAAATTLCPTPIGSPAEV